MTEYETLLNDAYTKVKVVEGREGRFEVPAIEGHIEGKKTIMTNVRITINKPQTNAKLLPIYSFLSFCQILFFSILSPLSSL